jgi:diguanylate cyclase (GGDEF)-like protein/PAS domain S-box-containing protein
MERHDITPEDPVTTPDIPSVERGGPARLKADRADVEYRGVLERIPAITYIAGFGESGAWEYVSPQIERMLGFTTDEWLRDPDLWYRQIHPDDRARALEDEANSKMSGEPLSSEYRMFTLDGRTIWVRDEAVLVRDAEGNPLHWQGFMVDITDRKQTEDALQESEARYRGLFDHVPVGLYRSSPSGELLDGNRALAQILGYPSRDALLAAKATDIYLDPSDRERWQAVAEGEGLVRDFELQVRRGDGSVIWVRDSGRAVRDRDERILHFEGALQDITLRKQAEWEARQANQQLSSWVNELERRNREMSMINEMADMLQSCPTAEEAHTVMAHWAEQLFSGQSGALYVISPSRNLVEPVAVWSDPALGEAVFAPGSCWALRTGRPHVVKDPGSRLTCLHLSSPPRGASLCIPMMAQGEALGILHLQLDPQQVTMAEGPAQAIDSAKQLAVTVAEHLALALANLKLRETLRTQSIRDPLTKLFNRRYMEESLERELSRAERRSQTVGVVMLDLDHFSRFNNAFGHQAGDMLLQAFGELVHSRIRAEDIACRYGGEEFTLIMPEAPMEVLVRRADELRQAVRELRLDFRGQSLGTVTVSAGVAAYPSHGRTADSLINAADVAMYRAKAEGRDRVVAAEAPTSGVARIRTA